VVAIELEFNIGYWPPNDQRTVYPTGPRVLGRPAGPVWSRIRTSFYRLTNAGLGKHRRNLFICSLENPAFSEKTVSSGRLISEILQNPK
jgi:hypothetical protein